MADTLVMMRVEHRNFLRVLAVLDEVTDAIRHAGTEEVDLLKQVMAYFLGFPDRCHHPKEDLVFRRLRERDPEAAAAVGDLLGDHDDVGARVAAMSRRVNAYDGGPDPGLADELAAFSASYRAHLEAEETRFFRWSNPRFVATTGPSSTSRCSTRTIRSSTPRPRVTTGSCAGRSWATTPSRTRLAGPAPNQPPYLAKTATPRKGERAIRVPSKPPWIVPLIPQVSLTS